MPWLYGEESGMGITGGCLREEANNAKKPENQEVNVCMLFENMKLKPKRIH